MRVCVFCGSSEGVDPAFREGAEALGGELARRGHGVVYGGSSVGLMGAVADAALAAGGHVHGVIPVSMVDREVAHPGLTALDVVDGMHARKARMAELSDAFVALPGGLGTLEELFEVWTWRQLGLHDAPLALLDVDGFYTPLRRMVDTTVESGFVSVESRSWLVVEDDVSALVTRLEDGGAPDRPGR